MLSVGIKGEGRLTVAKDALASSVGSGSLPVFATPEMVLLIERTAFESLEPHLDAGKSTVGGRLDICHTAPSAEGSEILCVTEVTEIDRSRVVFRVDVSDGAGPIGSGTHERFVVDAEIFMRKASDRRR
ncbi:MAG: thioesterase family protein [Candidatus Methanoplasma sp.]|jgi:predicted thioesterase|nr:thioesterase family protein [Candidatus Methanoplasma sp.]